MKSTLVDGEMHGIPTMVTVNHDLRHTPGPWLLVDSYRNAPLAYRETHPRDLMVLATDTAAASICDVASLVPGSAPEVIERELANGQLIAAAPTLLEAAIRAVDRLNDMPRFLRANHSRTLGKLAEEVLDDLRAAINAAKGR